MRELLRSILRSTNPRRRSTRRPLKTERLGFLMLPPAPFRITMPRPATSCHSPESSSFISVMFNYFNVNVLQDRLKPRRLTSHQASRRLQPCRVPCIGGFLFLSLLSAYHLSCISSSTRRRTLSAWPRGTASHARCSRATTGISTAAQPCRGTTSRARRRQLRPGRIRTRGKPE